MASFGSILYKAQIFLPREKKFFDLFDTLAGKVVNAAELLESLENDYSRVVEISHEIKQTEEEADSIVHQILDDLVYDHTRVTEEKGDIRYFAHNLDNVIDDIEKVAARLAFTSNKTIPEPVKEFSPIIMKATREIKTAVGCLRNLKKEEKNLEAYCIEINRLENEADVINRKWLKKLMTTPVEDSNEVLQRLLSREIVDILEDTVDQCEDVADILDTFRIKGGI